MKATEFLPDLPVAQAAHDSPPPDGPVAPQSLDAGRQARLDAWKAATAALPSPEEIAAMDDRAYQLLQRDYSAQFWLERYEACPACFFAEFDRWSPRHQAAITHAVAAFWGVEVGEVDRRWLEAREGETNHGT